MSAALAEKPSDAPQGDANAAAPASVLKIGGRPLETAEGRARLAAQIGSLRARGIRLVVVHGGGAQVTRALEQAGIEARFVEGLRVTDERTLEVAEPVFAATGKLLAHALSAAGTPAVALNGRDALLLQAFVKNPALGRVGTVAAVNGSLLETLLDAGITPVVGPIAVDAHGALNVNADEVACAVAAALRSPELMLLTDVPGVRNSDGQPIALLTRQGAEALVEAGVATGGMVPKIRGALDALSSGVQSVRVLDPDGLDALGELRGAGTLFMEG